jgi:hypothetical protein
MSDLTDWVPEVRDVPVELTDTFDHATFPPKRVEWATVQDKIESATWEQLILLANGGTGNA